MTSISSDGGQSTVASGGDVYLQQGTSLGVGCICTTVGSRNPPTVQVYVGDDDVTADFNVSTEVDSDTQTSGLSFYQVVVRLSYVTTLPDRRLHGQRLVCTASRPEFDDVSATALLLVRCKQEFRQNTQMSYNLPRFFATPLTYEILCPQKQSHVLFSIASSNHI